MVTSESGYLRHEEQLDELIAAYLDQLETDRTPHPDEWLDRHPEFKAELSRFFADRHELERLAAPLRVIAQPIARIDTPGKLGDYRIVREIGRGGMGIVYEAEQISLHRRVALKVLPFAAVLDAKQVKRFKNEAQAAANLDHPHIVSVYSVGCDRGIHYYAMQFVEGQSLAEVVEQLRAEQDARCSMLDVGSPRPSNTQHPIPNIQLPTSSADTQPIAALSTLRTANPRERFREIARLGIQAAEALQYAHEMGIVHRDIKPSNLLVDAQGHLWIADFGLATTQTDAGLTMTGDLLGTLRYMSPEQAAGDRARIDYRTDIYSLGITLYELLTRQPAFADTDRQVMLRRIVESEPKSLRSVNTAIPRDLETIVLKTTEKEPHARYDSAAELAADLKRFCEDKPIRARRTARVERAWRWAKRNRLVAALSITVATLTALVAITTPIVAWRQARLIDETQQQLYAKDVSIAYNAWNDGDLGHVRELLDRYSAGSDFAHFRDFPWYYLDGLYQRATAGFMPGGPFDISLNANLLAVTSLDKSDDPIHLYDIDSWREVGTLPRKNQPVDCLRFSADGRYLAAGFGSGTLSAWDVRARKHLYTIAADSHIQVLSLAFSADGSMLASGGQDHDVKIWETKTGKSLRVLTGHSDDVSAVAFSPDGKTLATGSFDYSLRLWDTDSWRPRAVIEHAFPGRVYVLAYDSTGGRLASGGWYDRIIIWDAAGRKLRTLPKSGFASSLSFSPDGQLLAVGGDREGAVQVWEIEEERLVQQYRVGHSPAAVGFLPSGEQLLLTSDGKLMRRGVGDVAEPPADDTNPLPSEEVAVDISASGDLMVAAYGRYEADPGEGAIACWDLRQGTHRVLLGHDGSSVIDVAIDPSAERIVACGGPRWGPGFVNIWNARTGMLTAELPKQKNFVGSVAISPAGDRLAAVTVGPAGNVSVWSGLTSQPELLWRRDTIRAMRVAFSPDGDVLAIGCFGAEFSRKNISTVVIWDADTGEQLQVVSSERPIMDVAFSPNAQLLASIDWDGKVEVYDRQHGRTVLSELAHQSVGYSAAFSPDGRTLATASSSGDIKFWHVPTMMHVTTLNTRRGVSELAFFPDGQTLAVGYNDRTIELWHVDRDRELFRIDGAVDAQ